MKNICIMAMALALIGASGASAKEVRAESADQVGIRLAERAPKASARLVAEAERLAKISQKVSVRLDKAESSGKDMARSKELLASADALIDSAKLKSQAIASIDVSPDDPKGSLERLKAAAKDANGAVKKAHVALIDAITSIKAALAPQKNASSTPQGN
jgi:hypothetical protein